MIPLLFSSPFPTSAPAHPGSTGGLHWIPFLALGYYAGIELSMLFQLPSAGVSPFWLPNALFLWALLRAPVRVRFGLPFAVATALLFFAFRTGIPWLQEMVFIATNLLEVCLVYLVLRVFGPSPFEVLGLRTFTLFLAATAFGTAVAALLGAAAVTGAGDSYGYLWTVWWMGDLLGYLALGLPLVAGRVEGYQRRCWLEVAILLCVSGVVAGTVFIVEPGAPQVESVSLYLLLLPFIWAGIRLPMRLSFLTVGLLTLIATLGTMMEHGPFMREAGGITILQLQGFLVFSTMTTGFLGVVRQDHRISQQNEAELRALFQSALEHLPIGVGIHAIDSGKTLYLNSCATDIFNWPATELGNVDACFEKLIPEAGKREALRRRMDEDMASGDPSRLIWDNIEVTGQEGETRTVNLKNNLLPERNMVITSVVDVTASREAQLALELTLEKYRSLFENFPLGISVLDPDGHVLETNPAAEMILGISDREHGQRDIDSEDWKIVHPDGMEMKPEEYPAAIALYENRKVQNQEIGVQKPDGNVVWLDVTAVPLPSDAYGAVVTYTDITKRVQMERELRKSRAELAEARELLSRTFDGISDAISLVRLEDRTIEMCNASMKTVFGYEPSEVIGRSTEILHVDQEHFEEFLNISCKILERTGKFHGQFSMRRKDGTVFPSENTVTFVRDNKGNVRWAVSMARDITSRLQQEQRLMQAQKKQADTEKFAAIGRVASGVAHEINNPLAIILLSTELIQRGILEREPTGKLIPRVEKILRNVERCKGIMAGFSGYTHKAVGENRDIDLVEALREAAVDMRESGREAASLVLTSAVVDLSEIKIWREDPERISRLPPLDPDLHIPIHSRPGQLYQVFRNLIENALEATLDGGQVVVSCRQMGPEAEVVVADTGSGIDEEVLSKVFEPFFTTRDPGEGTGLGLYMSQYIVQKLCGELQCESLPGTGTLMRIRFLDLGTPTEHPNMKETHNGR